MRQILFIIPIFLLLVFSSCSQIDQNKKTGNSIVKKIELFKKTNGFLPNSLQEIRQDECINNVIFSYQKVDSVNYMVWFGTTLGEGIYYYSDTQDWENRLRGIGNWKDKK